MTGNTTADAYLALDIGAESGRAVLGWFDGERMETEEIHRFPNYGVPLPDGLRWDAPRLFHEALISIGHATHRLGAPPTSIGIDTWGCDLALLDGAGRLLANPYHYRDPRTVGVLERVAARVSPTELYATTGIQEMPINTLGQLLAYEDEPIWDAARTMLLMPDLLRYWLSGERTTERSIASTTQLYAHATGDWAWNLLAPLRLRPELFTPIIDPGQTAGTVRQSLLADLGLSGGVPIPVVSVAAHDTASAVVAIPFAPSNDNSQAGYISSGTWLLVGVERPSPVLTPAAMAASLTNEVGFGGTIRLLKNVTGLWLIQECRRAYQRAGHDYDYAELTAFATAAPAFGALIDPDHPNFVAPGDLPERIARRCQATGQPAPDGPGAVVRCAIESMALKCRWVFDRIAMVTNQPVGVVHIVGGGARNALLCQSVAGAMGVPVMAGAVEATALGNLLAQAMAAGRIGSLAEAREVSRRSSQVVMYQPVVADAKRWEEAAERFHSLMFPRQDGD